MSVRVLAPAKVNLSLRVLARRPDGYHEIRTVFQAVDLADEVDVAWSDRGIDLRVDGPDLGPVPDNLAYRAAAAFLAEAGVDRGVRVRLGKHVPAGAGLGGGSSDAAAVLRCLDVMVERPLGREVLLRLGAGLGSDVPFFLGESPRASATGRGERLLDLPPLPEAHLVLVMPPVHVSTASAYRALGREVEERVETAEARPGAAPRDWSDTLAGLRNDFEPVVAPAHPEVRASLSALRGAGALGCLLSGSGAACFGVFPDEERARSATEVLRSRLGWRCETARTLTRWPEPTRG